MRPVIRSFGIGKTYRLGGPDARYKTFRDVVTGICRIPFGRRGNIEETGTAKSFRALSDVSFEVRSGEIVGVLGRNGSGKSTLLKILSRITVPTSGRIEIEGRVGSLLEVGTGFHPELTGRENIYLNGVILGMKASEVRQVFDRIVEFAGVGLHLDTAVKRYSSGMHMRLAFAVAAHLKTEILLMDEVLAVGDIAFQKKCLGRINEVARSGRTVLLVSHNMDAVINTCSRCLLLESGNLVADGATASVVEEYRARGGATHPRDFGPGVLYEASASSRGISIHKVEVLDVSGSPLDRISTWDYVRLRFWIKSDSARNDLALEIHITTPSGQPVLRLSTMPYCDVPLPLQIGLTRIDCTIARLMLSAGSFVVRAGISAPLRYWVVPMFDLTILDVLPSNVYSSAAAMPQASESLLAIPHEWQVSA